MIKVLLIEDEIPARKKLKRFLHELDVSIEIMAEIDTVAEGIAFLRSNTPDLILSDIELLDGNSFEIYSCVRITSPIIFTTAYDQFWMNAFESNGIDYLLKPFSKERFQKAWEKFRLLRNSPNGDSRNGDSPNGDSWNDKLLGNLLNIMEQQTVKKAFKKRFVIQNHKGIHFLDIENINFFEASEGVVFANDHTETKHLLTETTLNEIEKQLDPRDFFRINRSELVNKYRIEKVERHKKNAVTIKLKGCQRYLTTSQSNTAEFNVWLRE